MSDGSPSLGNGQPALQEAVQLFARAIGVQNLDELRTLAEFPQIPLLLRLRYLLFPPAPKIEDPAPGGFVAAGRNLRVRIHPDPVDLDHELMLLPKSDSTNPPAGTPPVTIPGSAGSPIPDPEYVDILIPVDNNPATGTEYYLELGVAPNLVDEQQRHRIVIKTPPELAATLTGDFAPNTAATAYPIGTAVTFTITITGGLPPYDYLMWFGKPPAPSPVSTATSPGALSPETYATAGKFSPTVTVYDAAGNVVFVPAGDYFFA
jgi:hypothetical protein